MKRFGQKWTAFVIFLVMSWVVFSVFAAFSPVLSTRFFHQEHGYGTLHQRLTEWPARRDSIDILIVGPSVAYRSFHPEPFEKAGLKIFNLGTDSQTLPVSANVLEHALRECNPRLVVIPMFSDLWTQKATESRTNWIMHNQIQNWNWNKLGLEMCFKEASPKLLLQWVHCKTKALATDAFGSLRGKESDRYIRRGFTGSTLALNANPECSTYAKQRDASHRYVYNPILRIQRACDNTNTELLLVWTPTLCGRNFVFDAQSIPQLDGNNWPEKKTLGMYTDESHMTTRGALSYSQWILTEIKPLLSNINVKLSHVSKPKAANNHALQQP